MPSQDSTEQIVETPGRRAALGVEAVEVGGRALSQALDLALAQPLAAAALDRLNGVVERAPCGLDRGQAPQPVRVLLDGQVQHRVGRAQVLAPAPPVGQPRHPDRPEHAQQRPLMAAFDAAVTRPVAARDDVKARFPCGPQIEVILQELAEQHARVDFQQRLQFAVRQARRLTAGQPHNPSVKQLSRPLKRRRAVSNLPCAPPRNRPAGQELTVGRVT